MTKRVELHPAALAEAEEASAWYAKRSSRVALAFVASLEEAVDVAANAPALGAPHLHNTRRLPLRHFPFCVVYREEPARVVVYAVAHLRREPGYWAPRED